MIKYVKGQVWYYKDPNIKVTYHSDKQGSVQSGCRPVIIASNNIGNKHSPICIVIPCTSQVKNNLPTHFTFNIGDIVNTALCEQLTTVPQTQLASYIGTLEEKEYEQCDNCLAAALDIKSRLQQTKQPDLERKSKALLDNVKTQISTSKRIKRTDEEKAKILEAYESAKRGERTMQSIVDEYKFNCYSSLSSAIYVWKKEPKFCTKENE